MQLVKIARKTALALDLQNYSGIPSPIIIRGPNAIWAIIQIFKEAHVWQQIAAQKKQDLICPSPVVIPENFWKIFRFLSDY